MLDTLVAIKAETDDTITLAGWGVIYGGVDLQGTRFTRDTDFWLDKLGAKKVTLYDHGFDEAIKREVIGEALLTPQEDGLWVEAQLEKHTRYAKQIAKLAAAGALGWSSGAVAHLIDAEEAEDGVPAFKSWPIVEMSLTPTPAEPRTLGVHEIRALVAHADTLKTLLPEDASPAGAEEASAPEATEPTAAVTEASPAPEEPPAPVVEVRSLAPAPAPDPSDPSPSQEYDPMELAELAQEQSALKSNVENINSKLESLLQLMQDQPATKNAGYFTNDGGTADPQIKSFGDFLLAVRRNDQKRIRSIYGSVKDLTESVGAEGGFLVPPEYHTELLRIASATSRIVSMVRRIPVRSDAGSFPALNVFAAPTAGEGNSALAGGITAAVKKEGAALTETNATFKEVVYRIHKIGGYTEVTNELVDDSPQAIEALLTSLYGIAVANKLERNILRGSGVGEPLGILNATCALGIATVTNNVFAWADALAMKSRFKRVTDRMPVWVIHPGVWPDLGVFETTGGGGVWQANMAVGSPQSLLGYEIIESEHMPQDDNDDVLLADFGAYLLFERQALSVAFSEHAAFTSDMGTWRFTYRADGQPWLTDKITLADPQGSYTVTPFVYHDD